jgi:hypothetical protein
MGVRQLNEEEKARGGYTEEQRGEFFQVKNIFNSMSQIEKDLGAINKTAESIGSIDKLDKVLKKAGMLPELREQFIDIINKNPKLRKLKLSTVISTFVRESIKDSDKAYYEAIDKPLSKELEKTLIDYFDRFHIRREELDNLKEKFGVDSIGVFDVLAKTVYYAKNRNLLTLPEEYGHAFVELLGSISNKKANNPLFGYLFDNIEKWDGYKRVFDEYKSKYVTKEGNYDIYKIKKEAIGQAIGIALVRNYKNNKAANKSLWEKLTAKNTDFWTKIQEAIDHVADMLKGISYANINVEVDNIAKDILNKNYSKLDRIQKDTSNYDLLDYAETIENQNKKDGGRALEFMQWFTSLGNIITGSLAYRLQGTVYRPEIDALHDIDMIVPSDVHNVDLNKSTYLSPEQLENNRLYLKYTSEGNHKEAKKYKTSGNIKLDIDNMMQNEYFKKVQEKYPDLDFLYTFFNQKANAYYITVNAIWSKDQELKDRFKSLKGNFNERLTHFTPEELDQMYLFDFFLRPETSEEYTTIQEPQYNLNLAHFNYAFYEKLNMMGRAKDAYDYQNWEYFDKENILAPDFNDRLVYFQLQKSEEKALQSITPKTNIVNYRTMDDKSKEDAMNGVEEAQKRWVEEEIAEFYEAVEQYNKGLDTFSSKGINKGKATMADVIDETLGIFRTIQMFPKFSDLILPYLDDIKKALDTFGRKEGYDIYKAKKDAKGQAQDMTYDNLFEVVDRYLYRQSDSTMSQIEDMPMSKASPETIEKVKELAKKMGIDIQTLTDYAKAHPEIDITSVNGVADLVRGVIAVAEGREDVSLTEEMVHLATAILEQTNPKMVTEMISKIDRFEIYKQTLEAYKNNKNYQLANGKPDIRKIKKEAVDKLIAELIINQSEGSTEFPELRQEANRSLIRRWWNNITDAIRGMYRKSNISIFEEAAATIARGEVGGTVSDIENKDVFFQLSDAQKNTIDRIQTQSANIEKIVEDKKESDPLLLDSEEANNYYRIKQPDGTYIERSTIKRVTDRVKAWYKQRFGDKEFTEAEKKFNNLKREYGVKYHGYFDEIHARYYNEDGSKRDIPDDRPSISDPVDASVYDKIEKYYTELIDLLPEGTAVLTEVMVYDPKQKEAGTIDFLAIDKNGKANILDWKFMYIADESKTDDVAWFKQGAYNIQLGRYKEILKDAYGIKEFGMIRAVPFLMRFQRENPKDAKSPMILKGIVAGSADKTKIESLKLMPVAEETESTGYDELDNLIKKLNALLKQYSAEKVTDETEREYKIERLNTIRRAIRIVQGSQNIAPLIDVIEVMRKDGDRILEDYEVTYKNRPATREDHNNKDLSEFSEQMNNYIKFSDIFSDIGDYIGDLIYTDEMLLEAKTKEEKEYALQMKGILEKLENEQKLIRKTKNKITNAANDFADKHIGERNLVGGLTRAEAVIQGLSSWFRGVSELPMASLKVLYKLVTLAKGRASAEALKEVEELMAIRDKIAKSGKDLRATVRQLYQSDDKGGLINKLIYKYKKEFYDTLKEKKEEGGNKKWLLENINVEEYKKEAEAKMNDNIEKIKKRRYAGTKEEEEETRAELILQEKQRWDITRKDFNGWDNYIIKRHPKDIWLSDEYKNIEKDPNLLELYNFITKFNQKSKEVGYIENKVASVFLPFVRKSMAESLAWDGSLSAIQNFSNNLQLKADDVGFGKFNEITGELENSIPKYYTSDFTKKANGVNDYSEVSEDLFKNLILYVQHVNKYKYMSEIEGQLKLVKTIEEFKGHLNTDRSGKVIIKANGTPEKIESNAQNTKTFDAFLRALLYEQKYALSDADTPLYFSKVLNGVKKLVNKVAGKEIWKEDENPSATSLIKTMDAANKAFQLKTLGLDPISGLVNAFGANIQMSTQAGRYFKSREFLKNEIKLMGMNFNNEEERKVFVQCVDLFMPLKDDPSYELYKKAGMVFGTRRSASDDLMFFMRYPEHLVEKSVFETLLDNTMVENGRIVNIHDFVKNKYKGRTQEAGKYKETKAKIEKEIEELKNTKSIAKTRKLENGKLVIPGLDLNNREEIQRLTNLTRTISRNATGGLADMDVNKASMSIWGKSAMVFRGWIPKLADTRFSEFRKVSDDFSVTVNDDGELEGERYDIGRLRLLGHVLMNSISSASNNITNILQMNEKGVAEIDRIYEEYAKKYEEQTGQKMTMNRDEFADMIRTNLRNQLKELLILATLVSTMFALGFMAPDDDKDKSTKNAFRYTQRVVDKFVGELSFFYNPANFEQLLSGSAFPAIGLIADFYKVMSNFFMEVTGFDFTDPTKTPEEIRKKAMPIKRVVNMVPAGKSIMTWLSMINSEFAKEFDITIQKQTSVR